MPTLRQEVSKLSAQVTALIMLVEALYVDGLAKDDNAARITDRMIRDGAEKERQVRDELGESGDDYELWVSETISSLLDRAAKRAAIRRSRRGRA